MKLGCGQTVLIAAEAGVGKTRLTSEAATYAQNEGCNVLRGSCFQSDQNSPYAPILDLLRGHFADRSTDAVVTALGAAAREFASLLPELLPELADQPLPPATDPVHARRRLFAALANFVFGLARDHPALVVVEDIHWADEASLDLLYHLARSITNQPVLLLTTYRTDEVHPSFSRWLAQLSHDRLASEMALRTLTRDEVDAMLHAMLGTRVPVHRDFVEELFALTEGNPFFVEELLAALLASGEIDLAEDGWDRRPLDGVRVPRSVQDAVLRRTERLSAAALRGLRLAAVAGHRFDVDLLQTLTGTTEQQLLELIMEWINLGLVVEETADLYSFRHALTRQAIYAELLGRERRGLHAAVAAALGRRVRANEVAPADLAYHYARAGDWERALPFALQAGQLALALHAPRVAAQQFTLALDSAARLGLPPPLDALRGRGRARDSTGDFDGARRDYEAVSAAASLAGDNRTQGEVLLELGLLWSGRDDERSRSCYQTALDLARASNEPVLLANSLNRLGNWLANADRPDEGLLHHGEALAVFRRLDDQRGLAATFDLVGAAHAIDGDLTKAAAAQRQAIAIFEALDDRRGLASSLALLACCGSNTVVDTVSPALTQVEAELAGNRAVQFSQEIGWRAGVAYALLRLSSCLAVRGETAQALPLAERALAVATEISHERWTSSAHGLLGVMYLDLLAPDKARSHLEAAAALADKMGMVYQRRTAAGRLASACVVDGDLLRAEVVLDRVLGSDLPARTIGQRPYWCARAELSLAQGQPALALAIVDRLTAETTGSANPGTPHIPRISALRGDVLMALGRRDEAETTLLAAHARAASLGLRPRLWRIELSLGGIYRSGHRQPDAEHWFGMARAGVTALAASVPEVTLREAFQQAASRLLPERRPVAGRVADADIGGLTSREREVAGLVGRGLTNKQIATALVVEKRTVETHIGNILAKLGYSSRAQLIALAIERGLVTATP